MNKFIGLTNYKTGRFVAVAIDKITSINEQDRGTDVWTLDGRFTTVQESASQIHDFITDAQK